MEAYTSFAQVYDLFMDNVPYEMWCDFLEQELKQNGISDGIIVDLGCGTGKMTRMMSKKGYDMIGIDNSMEMLNIAMEKRANVERAGKESSDEVDCSGAEKKDIANEDLYIHLLLFHRRLRSLVAIELKISAKDYITTT